MNVLTVYNQTQTYTNTIFEHLDLYGKYSRHRIFYCHHDQYAKFMVDLGKFDALVLHYSVRLPFDQISPSFHRSVKSYQGLKVLFIQDEYDYTKRAWHWIKELGFHLVFTCVPEPHIKDIYPEEEFPDVRFVNNLTGYVPENLPKDMDIDPPSQRDIMVGYRGRSLSLRYGALPMEKMAIGRMVKKYCQDRGIKCDIAWDEGSRIYGDAWYRFVASCRAMLGTESGSNVFDWDGDLEKKIHAYRRWHRCEDQEIYAKLVKPMEMTGVMNQISPKVFEAITFRTVLILFEGNYSGVLLPDRHYLSLKKDGSNLDDVFDRLMDARFIDSMAERAYDEIIKSGRYSYRAFAATVDDRIEEEHARLAGLRQARDVTVQVGWHGDDNQMPSGITTKPIRYEVQACEAMNSLGMWILSRLYPVLLPVWCKVPYAVRARVSPALKWLIGIRG